MRNYYFEQFLNHFWLRPENALLLSLRAEAYANTFKFFNSNEKSIDVSCGDGVFSFITFGGQLSPQTDMFRAITLGKREGEFDAFDTFDASYIAEVIKKPQNSYSFGFDWKNNLLNKANKLSFYEKLIVHDNNKTLPLQSESVSYIYSNSAYWVENFEGHIRDLVRVAKPNGHVVLQIKTDNIKKLSSTQYAPFFGESFHTIIDAGRMSTWKGLKSKNELLDFFTTISNVEVVECTPVYGDIMAMIWDIGLRPLFNPLVKMANNLSEIDRVEVKKEWNQIFLDLFSEFLDSYQATPDTAIEYTIVLQKK